MTLNYEILISCHCNPSAVADGEAIPQENHEIAAPGSNPGPQ